MLFYVETAQIQGKLVMKESEIEVKYRCYADIFNTNIWVYNSVFKRQAGLYHCFIYYFICKPTFLVSLLDNWLQATYVILKNDVLAFYDFEQGSNARIKWNI